MDGYYTNISLNDEGLFKNNNHALNFGLKEVLCIYNNLESSISELIELTGLSYATIRIIKSSIEAGVFNEYILTNENNNDENTDNIIINDGVHINIYNTPQEVSVEENKHISNLKIKKWSKKIRARGKYTCAKCGKKDVAHAQSHHIFPKSRYPALAADDGNGICLCQKCHSEYHKRYKGKENPYTLIEWLNEYF